MPFLLLCTSWLFVLTFLMLVVSEKQKITLLVTWACMHANDASGLGWVTVEKWRP